MSVSSTNDGILPIAEATIKLEKPTLEITQIRVTKDEGINGADRAIIMLIN